MPTIDELFATMESDSMYEDVHDIIYIDPVTRQLHIPRTELVLGVKGDKRGERKYFSCPNVVGNGVALAACSLKVCYTNANGEEGSFCVSDIVQDENSTLFSWELSEKVTRHVGDVTFTICVCREVNGVVANEWATTTAVGKVLDSKMTSDDVDEEEDHGGAGGLVNGMYMFAFNKAAYARPDDMTINYELLDATIGQVDTTVSAPWKLEGHRGFMDGRLDEHSLHMTATGEASLVLTLRISKNGKYLPSLTWLRSEEGYTATVYLSKRVDTDDAMSYGSSNAGSYDAVAEAIAARVASMRGSDSEVLGSINTSSASTANFDAVDILAGDYILIVDGASKVIGELDIASLTLKRIKNDIDEPHITVGNVNITETQAADLLTHRGELDEHASALSEHDEVLDEHTDVLLAHDETLDEHTKQLGVHGASLKQLDEESAAHGENINKLYNSAANAIRTRVSGKTITITDVSPMPHKMRVEVKGTNMIEYPYKGSALTNGITYTDNGDGTVIADGTSSSFSFFIIRNPNEEAVYLEAGKTYRLSGAPVEAGIVMPLMVTIGEDNFYDFGEGVTFTPATSGYPYIRIYASSVPASVSNLAFKPHLYEVVDVSSVKISCNGATYYPSADGILEIDSKSLNTAADFQNSFCPYAYISNTAGYTLEVTYNKNPIATAKDIESKLKQHADATDNPHNVTAEQVGLGNVDNTSDMDKPVSTAMQRALNDIEAIAKGRATGYVFDTVEDLDAWLSDTANTSQLVLGDSLYIRDTSVPDYWWDGTSKQELETQKVDLTEYVKNTDWATATKAGVVRITTSAGLGIANGGIYIQSSSEEDIKKKTEDFRPITPMRLEYAVEVCTNQDSDAELTEVQLRLPPSTQFMKSYIEQEFLGGAW